MTSFTTEYLARMQLMGISCREIAAASRNGELWSPKDDASYSKSFEMLFYSHEFEPRSYYMPESTFV